jgi:hypothetical protein
MTKAELVAKLEGAKELTSVVSIDLVIAALGMLEEPKPATTTISSELFDEMTEAIRRSLDYNTNELVDTDSAEFSLNYNNQIELERIDVDVDQIMSHVDAVLDQYISIAEDEEDEFKEEAELTCDPGCGCCTE